MNNITIIGSFNDDELCAHAIEALREASIADVSTFSPIPSHHIELALGRSRSPVRWIALTGGITGVISALALTIGTTYEWRLNAGGRPLRVYDSRWRGQQMAYPPPTRPAACLERRSGSVWSCFAA